MKTHMLKELKATKYGVIEFAQEGPSDGNPFTEQWIRGSFEK
jgi:hypothetical protein